MKTSQILKAAKALINNPDAWCQGARAKNIEGRDTKVMSPSAIQFCSKGALLRVVGDEQADITLLEKHLFNSASMNYVGFNELHSHDEVMEMWEVAIAKAEQEEALEALGKPTFANVLLSKLGV